MVALYTIFSMLVLILLQQCTVQKKVVGIFTIVSIMRLHFYFFVHHKILTMSFYANQLGITRSITLLRLLFIKLVSHADEKFLQD